MAPIRRRLNNPRGVGEDGHQGQGRNMQSTATTSQQAAGDVYVHPIGNIKPPLEKANNDNDLVDDKVPFETSGAKKVIWKLKRLSTLAEDITLKTNDGKEFSAHMVILAARSPVFGKIFSTEMSEKKTIIVKIDDIGGPAFKVIFDFMYTGNVDSNWLDNYEEVIYGAEKYNLPLLKSYCDQTLAKACTSDNALNLLKLSRRHNLIIATKMITEYIKVNVDEVLNTI